MAKISIHKDSELIIKNQKIVAIKAFRTVTELGLKDSKHLVDKMFADETIDYDLTNHEAGELLKAGYDVVQDAIIEYTKKAATLVKEAMGLLLDVDQNHYLALLNNAYGQMKAEIDGDSKKEEKFVDLEDL